MKQTLALHNFIGSGM